MAEKTLLETTLEYVELGWSVVPLIGKQPPPGLQWGAYRQNKATKDDVQNWFKTYGDKLTGVGLITGYVESVCVLDLEAEEAPDRLLPGAGRLQGVEERLGHHSLVPVHGGEEERPLAAEGAVQAAPLDSHAGHQVLDGRRFVPVGPEGGHGSVENRIAIERPPSRHAVRR